MRTEVKDPRGKETPDNQNEGPRNSWRDHPQCEDDDKRDDADQQSRPAEATEGREPGSQLLNRVGSCDICPGQLWKLADHHVDGCPKEESGDHGARQELGNPSHFEHGQKKKQHSRRKGDCRDEGCHVLRPRDLRREHRAGRHCRQSRTRSGRNLATCSEDGIEDRSGGGCIEAVLDRNACDGCVPQILWNDQRRDSHSSDEIASEPSTLVGTNPSDHRHVSPPVTLADGPVRTSHQPGRSFRTALTKCWEHACSRYLAGAMPCGGLPTACSRQRALLLRWKQLPPSAISKPFRHHASRRVKRPIDSSPPAWHGNRWARREDRRYANRR